jgi:hypothetical protein
LSINTQFSYSIQTEYLRATQAEFPAAGGPPGYRLVDKRRPTNLLDIFRAVSHFPTFHDFPILQKALYFQLFR